MLKFALVLLGQWMQRRLLLVRANQLVGADTWQCCPLAAHSHDCFSTPGQGPLVALRARNLPLEHSYCEDGACSCVLKSGDVRDDTRNRLVMHISCFIWSSLRSLPVAFYHTRSISSGILKLVSYHGSNCILQWQHYKTSDVSGHYRRPPFLLGTSY